MKKPIVILNPKCATTSIRTALKLEFPKTHHIHLRIAHPKMQRHIRNNPDSFIGIPVRHPLDRALSCYHFWKRPRKRAVRENYVLQAFAMRSSASQFFLNMDLEQMAKVVPHFDKQVSFIRGGEDQIDDVIRFENLQADFTLYCAALGGTIQNSELPHKFKTNHRSWEEEFSPETIHKLAEFYSDDFKEFKYDF